MVDGAIEHAKSNAVCLRLAMLMTVQISSGAGQTCAIACWVNMHTHLGFHDKALGTAD
jgi:hypothetical protein